MLTYETLALTDCLPIRCVRSPTAYLWVACALRHCKSSAHRLLTAATPALCGGARRSFTDCLPMRRLRFLHGVGAVSAASLSACMVSQGLTLLHTSAAARSRLNIRSMWSVGRGLRCRAGAQLCRSQPAIKSRGRGWVHAAANRIHNLLLKASSSARARNSAAVVVGKFELPR